MSLESCGLYDILSALKHVEDIPSFSRVIISDSRKSLSDIKSRFADFNPHPITIKLFVYQFQK